MWNLAYIDTDSGESRERVGFCGMKSRRELLDFVA